MCTLMDCLRHRLILPTLGNKKDDSFSHCRSFKKFCDWQKQQASLANAGGYALFPQGY